MAADQPSRPGNAAPILVALEGELRHFELLTIRMWQAVAALGIVSGLVVAAAVSLRIGIAASVVAAFYLAWTVPAGWRLEHASRVPRWVRFIVDAVEATAPWTFLLVVAFVQGADYALASWVPPMLFCMVLFLNALRLRTVAPLVIGAAAGVTFPLLYFVVVRDRIPDYLASHLLFDAPMQVTRGISLVICGFLGSLGARSLRRAFFRAEGLVRERDLFGKYRLKGRIARGGMGEVIEALYCPEGGFERRVAIKRIHPHLAEQPRFVSQFRTEAELCARLAHPNIVQVLDFGRVDNTYFLAMDLVDGMTLAQLLKCAFKRGISIPEHVVGAVARDICAGLHHAHTVARGPDGQPLRVVHRDLCPQNILLSFNGEVKISDFGVARALKDAESSLTRTVVGHTAYMAPEQARAESIDPRVDLFGVGVIVWEMLVVRRLFLRDTDAATLEALLHAKVPRVTTLRPAVNPGWEQFLLRALARDPEKRFGSATEMSSALDDIPTSRGEGAAHELATMIALVADDDVVGGFRATAEEGETLLETPSARHG